MDIIASELEKVMPQIREIFKDMDRIGRTPAYRRMVHAAREEQARRMAESIARSKDQSHDG